MTEQTTATEADDRGPLTQEQAQRMEAVQSAGVVLASASPGQVLSARGTTPGKMHDIVDLANYIVTGVIYCDASVERNVNLEKSMFPLIGMTQVSSEDLPPELRDLISGLFDKPKSAVRDEDLPPFD